MNSLFDTAGAFLYFVLSIVLIPLFLLTDLVLWSIVAVRTVRLRYRRLVKAYRAGRLHWPALDRQMAHVRKLAHHIVHESGMKA